MEAHHVRHLRRANGRHDVDFKNDPVVVDVARSAARTHPGQILLNRAIIWSRSICSRFTLPPVTPTLTIRGLLRATLPSAYLLVIELTKVVEVPRPVSRKVPRATIPSFPVLVSCSEPRSMSPRRLPSRRGRLGPAICQLQTLRITIFALDRSSPDTDLSCPQVLSICDWRCRQVGRIPKLDSAGGAAPTEGFIRTSLALRAARRKKNGWEVSGITPYFRSRLVLRSRTQIGLDDLAIQVPR